MQKKTADKRPWKMIVLVAGIFIVDLVMLVATRDSYSSFNEFFDNLAWIIIGLIFASVGGLILIRQPRHIIGWLLMGASYCQHDQRYYRLLPQKINIKFRPVGFLGSFLYLV